jgi:hypothetical protein
MSINAKILLIGFNCFIAAISYATAPRLSSTSEEAPSSKQTNKNWTKEQDAVLTKACQKKQKWSEIIQKIPEHTIQECKARWKILKNHTKKAQQFQALRRLTTQQRNRLLAQLPTLLARQQQPIPKDSSSPFSQTLPHPSLSNESSSMPLTKATRLNQFLDEMTKR